MFAAIKDSPMIGQINPRLAKKKSSPDFSFRLLYSAVPTVTTKKATNDAISIQDSSIKIQGS